MKNTIKLTICAALIVLAAQVNALGTGSFLEVTRIGAKTFELTLENVRGDIDFQLRNNKSEILYQDIFESNGKFSKKFDMSLFPDGDYQLELSDNEKSQLVSITIKNNELLPLASDEEAFFFPTIHLRGEKVSINKLAVKGEKMNIKVVNPANQVVYNEIIEGKGNLGKIIDLSNTDKGSYEFILKSEGHLVSKTIEVK